MIGPAVPLQLHHVDLPLNARIAAFGSTQHGGEFQRQTYDTDCGHDDQWRVDERVPIKGTSTEPISEETGGGGRKRNVDVFLGEAERQRPRAIHQIIQIKDLRAGGK